MLQWTSFYISLWIQVQWYAQIGPYVHFFPYILSHLLSKVSIPIYSPICSVWALFALHPSQHLVLSENWFLPVWRIWNGVSLRCGFNLNFPDNTRAWTSFPMRIGHWATCSKSIAHSLFAGYWSFSNWFVGIICMFWIPFLSCLTNYRCLLPDSGFTFENLPLISCVTQKSKNSNMDIFNLFLHQTVFLT